MSNFFESNQKEYLLWDLLGNIEQGRQNLGSKVPVFIYRLFEYSLKEELTKQFGSEQAAELFRNAGERAGKEFAKNMLDLTLPMPQFFEHLQTTLSQYEMGILRCEQFDAESGTIILTISEDLDCSGLPIIGDTVCHYDEGFLKGILTCYTKHNYCVREIDCWATGSRVCRFEAKVLNESRES